MLVVCGSLQDPLCRPVVDPRRLGGSVDRCAITVCFQHGDHRHRALRGHAGCNQFRRKVCIDLCNVCIAPCALRLR